MKTTLLRGAAILSLFGLAACGGGSDGSPATVAPPPPVNIAPEAVLESSVATVREGDGFQLDAGGSSDADGDTLTYTITQTAGPMAVISAATAAGTSEVTAPDVDADAVLSFEVSVSDGNGGTDVASVDVSVTANAAPVAEIAPLTPAGALRFETTEFTFNAAGSTDPEGDTLSYAYRVLTAGIDLGIDVSGAGGPEVSFIAPRVDQDVLGTLIVTVTDSFGDSNEARTEFTVLNNTPPTVNLTAREAEIDEGQEAVIDVTATLGDRAALIDSGVFSVVQIAGPEVEVDASGLSTLGDSELRYTAPEVEADEVVTLELQLDDGIDVATARVDVRVENLVLSPDAGLGLSKDATLQVGRPVADALIFDSDDILLVTENPDRDPDAPVFDRVGAVSLETVRLAAGGEGFFGPNRLIADYGDDVPSAFVAGDVSEAIGVTDSGLTFSDIAISGVGGVSSTQVSSVGVLGVPGACAVVETFAETSAGPILLVGRSDGVSLFSYRRNGSGIDFDSIRELDAITDGGNYCTLTSPQGTGASGPGSNTSNFLAFDGDALNAVRFSFTDDGASGVTLTKRDTVDVVASVLSAEAQAADLAFVDGDTKDGSVDTMAVVLSDGEREGAHAIVRLSLSVSDTTKIEVIPFEWSLGVPEDIAFESFEQIDAPGRSRNTILVSLPNTPFLLSAPDAVPTTAAPIVARVSYSEVGLGFDGIAESSVGTAGGGLDSLSNSLVLFNSETGEVARFEVASP